MCVCERDRKRETETETETETERKRERNTHTHTHTHTHTPRMLYGTHKPVMFSRLGFRSNEVVDIAKCVGGLSLFCCVLKAEKMNKGPAKGVYLVTVSQTRWTDPGQFPER